LLLCSNSESNERSIIMLTDIIRWDPLREFGSFGAELERLMKRAGAGSTLPQRWSPASDVIETENTFVVTAELPGVKDEDIHITVQNGILRVSGERHLEEEVSEERSYRLERSYGGFERTFALPPGVSEDDISAGVAYGVLKITIPKSAAPEPKVIAVNPLG
jgi:HSP20 family protein